MPKQTAKAREAEHHTEIEKLQAEERAQRTPYDLYTGDGWGTRRVYPGRLQSLLPPTEARLWWEERQEWDRRRCRERYLHPPDWCLLMAGHPHFTSSSATRKCRWEVSEEWGGRFVYDYHREEKPKESKKKPEQEKKDPLWTVWPSVESIRSRYGRRIIRELTPRGKKVADRLIRRRKYQEQKSPPPDAV